MNITKTGSWGTNITWNLYDDNTLILQGSGAMVEKPDGENFPWEEYKNKVATVEIKEGITYIAKEAFSNFTMVSLVIEDGAQELGASSFEYCSNLRFLSLPSTLQTIGEYTFKCNTSLTTVFLPEGLINLKHGAFIYCENLYSLTLPNTLITFDSNIITDTVITKLVIPENVQYIGSGNFFNLETVLLLSKVPPALEVGLEIWESEKDLKLLENIYVPEENLKEYKQAWNGRLYAKYLKGYKESEANRIFPDDNPLAFTLGLLSALYLRRELKKIQKSPLIDLDFKKYQQDSSIIENKGSLGTIANATVNLNNGSALYTSVDQYEGLLLRGNANFTVPVNIIKNNIDSIFTWVIQVGAYTIRDAAFCRLCRGNNDFPSIFYYGYANKFCAKLSELPSPNTTTYNPKIVTYDKDKGFIFEVSDGDILAFTCDGIDIQLYINGEKAISMPWNLIQEKKIDNIGCGDTSSQTNYYFQNLLIKKFMLFDKLLSGEEQKMIGVMS